ncbi:MAG: hypothetical protein LBT29_00405 [Flavobacteriaceae bacterium]|jgi:hypothetical protein|nr:hypothetical protein [Flavobacteriaceae bacterium]
MNDLTIINKINEVSQNMGKLLTQNKDRAEKGAALGKKLISKLQTEGVNAENDERANSYLVNCRTAVKEMQEQRKPFTAFLDQIKKEFTSAENALDVSKTETEAAIIQSFRNDYVRRLKEEEEQKKKEAAEKLAKQQEAIDIKTEYKKQLSTYIQNYIIKQKNNLQNGFNSINLADFDRRAENLKNLKTLYPESHYMEFTPDLVIQYHSIEETQVFIREVLENQNFALLKGIIEGEINAFIKDLTDKLPSLKLELERIAKADEAEAEKLKKEKTDREANEKTQEAARAKAEADKKAQELNAQNMAQKTEAMMDTELELFATDNAAPETRQGFKINILHQAGVMEIISFWFEGEGKTLTIAELEKKSIGQMKLFCEKHAHKTGEKIVSKFLSYESIYKAVNKK